MPMNERRVYRSGSTRRRLRYVAAALLVALGTVFVYELIALPRVAAVSPVRNGFVTEAVPEIVLRVHGLGGLDGLRVTLDGRDVTGWATWEDEHLTIAGIELEDGTHTVRIRAKSSNLLRRRLDEQISFTVDTAAPEIVLADDVADGTLTTDPPEIVGTTEPRARVTVTAGAPRTTAYADGDGAFVLRPELAPGPVTLELTAIDIAGNTATATLNAYVDATVPVLVVDDLPKRVRKATLTLRMSATDTDRAPTVAALLDDEPVEVKGRPGSARVKLEGLAQGKHVLVVTATDRGGNVAGERRAFVVDSTETFGVAALWPGARGRDVRQLQKLLDERGFFEGEVNGSYDGATRKAVESFQARYGLAVDGLVDGGTLTALSGRIVVDLSELSLRFYSAGKLLSTYRVATGQSAYPTPTGTYAVIRMIVNPTWYPPNSEWAKDAEPIPPGIENPLGTRWIGTSAPDVGIHGTPDDASIGTYASHGCIRMHIPDVEELYDQVALGMTVVIQP